MMLTCLLSKVWHLYVYAVMDFYEVRLLVFLYKSCRVVFDGKIVSEYLQIVLHFVVYLIHRVLQFGVCLSCDWVIMGNMVYRYK